MKFTLKIVAEAYGNVLLFEEEKAAEILKKFGKRVIYVVNKKHTFHGAILFSKALGHYIYFSIAKLKELELNIGDEIDIEIKKDTSTYQFAICEEFIAVFETDPEASKRFEQLTDGKKRGLMHFINKAKRSETRINRALKLAENLKLGITDPRELIR